MKVKSDQNMVEIPDQQINNFLDLRFPKSHASYIDVVIDRLLKGDLYRFDDQTCEAFLKATGYEIRFVDNDGRRETILIKSFN